MITLQTVFEKEPDEEGKGGKGRRVAVDTSKGDLVEFLSEALKNRAVADLRLEYFKADFLTKALASEPKLAEWKGRIKVKESREYVARRKRFLEAEHDVEILRTLLGTHSIKG